MSEHRSLRDVLLHLVDRALQVADGLAERRVAALRQANPTMSPAELIAALEREYTGAVVATGAGTGLVAAVPAVGLPVAVGLAGADLLTFLTASAAHALAVARIHGQQISDVEYQRALLLGVLLGNSGSKVVLNTAGRAGVRWGQVLGETVPIRIIREINEALGGLLLKKFGPRAGLVTFFKLTPLARGALLGGVGNLALAREVLRSAHEAFGEAPVAFPDPPASATGATGGTGDDPAGDPGEDAAGRS